MRLAFRGGMGLLVCALAVAGVAHAQVSGAGLLNIDPDAQNVMAPPRASDEQTPSGAAVPVPNVSFKQDQPVAIEADEFGYDQQNAIVVAQGHVQVGQGPYLLSADKLTYFQRSNLVKASGNVSMLQPSGDIYFADFVELKDDMKKGVIYNFQARLADNSVFAANEARKISENVTQLKKAAYTPCNLCEGIAPFWQMKASKIKIDETEEEITYNNARMEMFGVPMFYTPYLSHPTPDAEAKSGFLTPSYTSGGTLGTMVRVPYYWRIAPDRDITLTPWLNSEVGTVLEGDYRQLTDGGNYSVRFSGTFPEKLDAAGNEIGGTDFRGHIYADGMESLTDYSRVGFNIARASDDTYIRRYRFGDQRVLFSRLYGEAARNRNYALVQGLALQGLRATDDPDTTPLVVPTFEGYYETDPYDSGLTLHAFGNAQSLTRKIGVDQHRLSITEGASLPMITDDGHIFTATANIRQDLYQVANVPIDGGVRDYDGGKGRVIPQAALEWRYPLIKNFGSESMTIEPVVLGVAQTTGNNPQEIPNEDTTLIELTDTNLFSLDRMPGLDLVDSGSRLAYGFRSQYLFADGTSIDGLLGQNYNFDDDTPFPNSTRQGENVSDIIGRLAVDYDPVTLGYRFAWDRKSFAANRTEFTAGFYKPWLTLSGVYRSIENNRYLEDSEEGIVNASMPVPYSKEWSIYGGMRRDLDLDQMIASNAGLLYRNECFTLVLQSLRTYTRDRDIEPNTEFTLRVGFKNLGEFGGN